MTHMTESQAARIAEGFPSWLRDYIRWSCRVGLTLAPSWVPRWARMFPLNVAALLVRVVLVIKGA